MNYWVRGLSNMVVFYVGYQNIGRMFAPLDLAIVL